MTIATVWTRPATAALHTPFVTALREVREVVTTLVAVQDADGRTGWGEAPQAWQVTGESQAGTAECVNAVLGPLVIGADPEDLTALCRRIRGAIPGNHSAKAALDIALHDLVAQRRGISLARLLGGTATAVATDVTIAVGDAGQMATAARERVAEGFTVLKVKLGLPAGPGSAGDLGRLRAVRAAAGPQVAIRVDANQGWTSREAVRIIGGFEDTGLDVEFVEQPVAAGDLPGLKWVTDRVATPIMADESLFGLRDLMQIIQLRAVDMVNVKLAKCGGLDAGRTLLAVAAEHGLGTMVGSMMETSIGVGAAAGLAAAAGTSVVSDLDAAWWLASADGVSYDQGMINLPGSAHRPARW